MRAPQRRVQRTLMVDGRKIKMVARRRTIQANHAGWNVSVNGHDFYFHVLGVWEAFDLAMVKFSNLEKGILTFRTLYCAGCGHTDILDPTQGDPGPIHKCTNCGNRAVPVK